MTYGPVFMKATMSVMAIAIPLTTGSALAGSKLLMGIGDPIGTSYDLGIAISSLVKVKLRPFEKIDLDPILTDGNKASLTALESGQIEFAVASLDESVPLEKQNIRAVATFDGDPATALLAHRSVDEAVVGRVLKTIVDGADFLVGSAANVEELTSDASVNDSVVPLHAGVEELYRDVWTTDNGALASVIEEVSIVESRTSTPTAHWADIEHAEEKNGPPDARNFVIYFNLNEANLGDSALSTMREAAAFAETLSEPVAIVAAYTDTLGDSEYNFDLTKRRADAVMNGLRSLNVGFRDIDLELFEERSPSALTLNDVNEADNRRVELFVEELVPKVSLAPIIAEAAYAKQALEASIKNRSTPKAGQPAPTATERSFKDKKSPEQMKSPGSNNKPVM